MAGSLTKAFNVLRVMRRTPGPLSLTAIAEEAGIAPSSAHVLLGDLRDQGLVVQDRDKRYTMGPTMYYLGASFARNTAIYRAVWRDLVSLCNELELVGVVAVPWEEHHLILQAHQAGSTEVTVAFGGRIPLDGGSWGKVYFAWSGATPPERLFRYTDATITDREEYARGLERTRERGYAVDDEEFATGVGAVAAAVTSQRGYEGLAACLGPVRQFGELGFDDVGKRLASIASQASFSLGDATRMTFVGGD
jgi:IclR family acetate operon transcriptional repressor